MSVTHCINVSGLGRSNEILWILTKHLIWKSRPRFNCSLLSKGGSSTFKEYYARSKLLHFTSWLEYFDLLSYGLLWLLQLPSYLSSFGPWAIRAVQSHYSNSFSTLLATHTRSFGLPNLWTGYFDIAGATADASVGGNTLFLTSWVVKLVYHWS